MTIPDGMNHAPRAEQERVTTPGDFPVGVIGLDHGHIYAMCHGLEDAGAGITRVYDPDPEKVNRFCRAFPTATPAESTEAILDDARIQLVASAIMPSERGRLGLRVQEAGKHYFVDKAPFTTEAQLRDARASVERTGKKWAVFYSERLQNEAAVFAGQLIEENAIGDVIQVLGLGPHRLQAPKRPEWFFRKENYGGILIDIGSHQIEQFLHYSGARDATVLSSQVGNYRHTEYPGFEDFGEATLRADNGATNYFRVDWFTPDGLSTWGDGRTFILGTKGYIELRKYVDIARKATGDHCYLVNDRGEEHYELSGRVGFPYFAQLITDCQEGSEHAMSQEHAFKAAELCLKVQAQAQQITAEPAPRRDYANEP